MLNVIGLWIGCFAGVLSFIYKEKYWPDYNEIILFGVPLPLVVYCAGALVDKDHFVANLKGFLMWCIMSTLVSVATVSLGAAYFLPKFGVDTLGVSDYLAIGVIFMSSNIIFALPGRDCPHHEVYDEFSMVFGEGAFGIAISIALLKLIKGVDLASHVIDSRLVFYFLGYFGFVLVASSMMGIFIGWLISSCSWIPKFIIHEWEDGKADPFQRGLPEQYLRGATYVLVLPTIPLFFVAEFMDLSGTLCVFFYGIITTHYIWPKVTEYKDFWKKDIHGLNLIFKVYLSMWVGYSAVRLGQWSCMGNQTWTFFSVSAVLCILLLLGRAIPICYLLLWGMRETETIEQTNNALLLNRWGVSNIEPKTQVSIWVSALMPCTVTYGLAYHQFGKSEVAHHELVLTCMIAVQLFSLLVLQCWIRGRLLANCTTLLGKQSKHSSNIVTDTAHEYVKISMEKEQE